MSNRARQNLRFKSSCWFYDALGGRYSPVTSNRAQIKEKIRECKIQKLEMMIESGEIFLRISKGFEKFWIVLFFVGFG